VLEAAASSSGTTGARPWLPRFSRRVFKNPGVLGFGVSRIIAQSRAAAEVLAAMIDKTVQQEWTKAVEGLIEEASAWSHAKNWVTHTRRLVLTEDKIGTYEVPELTVEAPGGRLILEPIARWSSPGEGRVDVLAWPSLNRLMLVRMNGAWVLLTEAGVRWPQAWSEQTFAYLVAELNAAA